MYGPEATVTIADKVTQPGTPRVLRAPGGDPGLAAGDLQPRDDPLGRAPRSSDETGAAYTQACRYPDGTNVLCATVIELDAA